MANLEKMKERTWALGSCVKRLMSLEKVKGKNWVCWVWDLMNLEDIEEQVSGVCGKELDFLEKIEGKD